MSPIVPHVPAWKKLGLKLKYAKQEVEEQPIQPLLTPTTEATPNGSKKRKASSPLAPAVQPSPLEAPLKKTRKIRKPSDTVLDGITELDAMIPDYQTKAFLIGTGNDVPEATEGKRKFVSFTPETKAEDGSSLKEAYGAWLKAQKADDPEFNAKKLSSALKVSEGYEGKGRLHLGPQVEEEVDQTSGHTSSRIPKAQEATVLSSTLPPQFEDPKKKKEKSKSKSKPLKTNADPSCPHLIYLSNHYTNSTTWKFSKPTQNYILKHLFSFRQIPSTYDPALLSYLSGLKGQSARQRIRILALDTRREDEAWLSSCSSSPSKLSKLHNDKENDKSESKDADDEMETSIMAVDEERHVRRREAYEAEVSRMKALLRKKEDEREDHEWELRGKKEWARRLMRRKRAEVVLWGVGEVEAVEEPVRKKVKVGSEPQIGRANVGDGSQVQANGNSTSLLSGDRGPSWMYGRDAGKLHNGVAPKKIVFADNDGIDDGVGAVTTDGDNGTVIPKDQTAGAVPTSRPAPTDMAKGGRKGPRKRRAKKRTGVPDDDDETSSSSDSSSESEKEGGGKLGRVVAEVLGNGRGKGVGQGNQGSSSSSSGSDDDSDDSDSN